MSVFWWSFFQNHQHLGPQRFGRYTLRMYIQYTYICIILGKRVVFWHQLILLVHSYIVFQKPPAKLLQVFFPFFSCTSRGDFLPHLRTQHLPRHSISRYHQENITDKTYKTIFRANPLCLTGNILNMYSCFPPPPEIRKPQQKQPQHLLPIPCCRWPWWWPWRRPRRWPGRRWPQGRWPRRGGPRCTEGGWSWAWPCRKERLVRHWHWDVQNLQHGPL